MSKQISENFPEMFLLAFTAEVLRATPGYRNSILKNRVRKVVYKIPIQRNPQQPMRFVEQRSLQPKINFQKVVQEKMTSDSKRITVLRQREDPNGLFAEFAPKAPISRSLPPVLIIPETKLPPTVQNIKPTPMQAEIDLRKLNALVQDPLVKVIECNGPNEKIVVMGAMGRKHTPTILSKEEVDDVINKFSEASKIPLSEGIYKVVFGKLVLSAIISEVIGSKFIIKKMGI